MEKNLWKKIEDEIKIDDTTINELAPKIVEGVDKLKKWSESI
jgi:aspartate aminotransferase